MTRRMLIDAGHPEETRVVILNDKQLVDFDFESSTKKQIKGNVYLAKVTRVEPSLQAAFVEYGGNRHGFLAFSEIHPDYFQIPQADRAMLEDVARGDEGEGSGNGSDDDDEADIARRRTRLLRSYKIQEVIKRRQIMLVQVVKEERGTKGAALTTYLSLAGRYCVLMPNTPRGGGISRKIDDAEDRKRLKEIAAELEVPKGMGLIIRTAGQERTRAEIRRDYDYLLRQWEDIRETTLKSMAPALIYEEGDLVKRAMRDLYSREIDEVLVEGDEAYKQAKRIMTMLIPSRSRQVKQYRDEAPLFFRYGVEDQLDAMHLPKVDLPSGGSIVIHTTEALTAIDVNSGKSTRERHIDETALKTNLEAADEAARQMRLRDLAGLIVIDFIDMADQRHERQVERRLRDALKLDRARLQIGKISQFGLLELSRQRMRPSLQELSTQTCPVCHGLGVVRSTESCALQALRRIQEVGIAGETAVMRVIVPGSAAYYLLNHKRDALFRLEQRYQMRVFVDTDDQMIPGDIGVERMERREKPIEVPPPASLAEPEEPVEEPIVEEEEELAERRSERARSENGRGRRDRRGGRRDEAGEDRQHREPVEAVAVAEDAAEEPVVAEQPVEATANGDEGEEGGRKRRRRRRRRRRGDRNGEQAGMAQELGGEEQFDEDGEDAEEGEPLAARPSEAGPVEVEAREAVPVEPEPVEAGPVEAEPVATAGEAAPADTPVVPLPAELMTPVEAPPVPEAAEQPAEPVAEAKPKRRTRAKKTAEVTEAATEAKPAKPRRAPPARKKAQAAEEPAEPVVEAKPKRRRTTKKAAEAEVPAAEPAPVPAPEQAVAPAAEPVPAPEPAQAPEPAKAEPAPAPEPVAAEAPARPVRRGWWNRLTGS
ncbi:MAG TPA: Rne/Rng family ribonuclease [Geminicoccus sp.]|uniref:Rne/Rng family ribonuclease n=1 Tax=Geminicoccus sp. TaxID=2024832 RepID=UPI002BFE9B0F|nr:Rne/Rng family ribonuclease [Geminicoccus sp.]HWL70355.1 Rne/Rng family ribonuclease [Geminicoccus sp.]